jgi:sugar phosphate isomerase/epimerase
MIDELSRRDVLKMLAAVPVAGAAPAARPAQAAAPSAGTQAPLAVGIVSRHLQFAPMEDAIAIAKEAEFDAIEWNVRDGGHVPPDRVERDLPRCIELTRQAGLAATMITTDATDADYPHLEAILATASGLGVTHYRTEEPRYDYSKDLEAELEALKPRLAAVNALNEKYGIAVAYHTHSGSGSIGGAIWDMWSVMREFDPTYLGMNFDVGHATRRLGLGMTDGLRIAHRYIQAVAVKDFAYQVDPQTGRVETEWTPIGEGQVNLRAAFEVLAALGWRGPINLHFEHHGLLGRAVGEYELPIPLSEFKRFITNERNHVRQTLQAVGF